jgi:hypothetical protein
VSCTSAFARIGETYDQAVQRYGKEYDIVKDPVTNDNIYRFIKGNFCVNAVFDNTDRIGRITYIKKSDSQYGESGDMSEVAQLNFLKNNCPEGWIATGYQEWVNGNVLCCLVCCCSTCLHQCRVVNSDRPGNARWRAGFRRYLEATNS